MNRHAAYDAVRDLIAAHQTSEVEQGSGIPAPSDAGREEVPLPASRPATTYPYPCPWGCGETFRSRKSRGAHVASVHPYTRIKPSYIPEPMTFVELPGDRWTA